MLQETSNYKNQEYPDLYVSSVTVIMLREMQRELNTGHPFGRRLHNDYSTKNHQPQLHAADDLDCCFMAFLPCGKPVGPRIMRKLSSIITTGQSENLRVQKDDKKEKQTEDKSRERGVECQLWAAVQRGYPEDAENSMVALPENDVRQSGRVLELRKQGPLVATNRYVLALSHPHDQSCRTVQELSFKAIREMDGQGGQDRGSQEAEEQEKR